VRRDAGAVLELTDETLREALASTAVAPTVEVSGEDVAYVLYTSGSTGLPKGVRVPHRAVVNFLASMQRVPGIAATDTLVGCHHAVVRYRRPRALSALVTGAKVVVASRDATRDGRLLADLLASSGATIMQATPVTWRMLLATDWRPSPQLRILCGGEACPPTWRPHSSTAALRCGTCMVPPRPRSGRRAAGSRWEPDHAGPPDRQHLALRPR